MHYKKAIDIINARRGEAERLAGIRYMTALEDSAFYEAEKNLKTARLQLLKSSATTLKKSAVRYAKERADALKRLGLADKDFEPKYTCSRCDDTGRDGKGICNCAKNLSIDMALSGTAAFFKNASFDTVDLDIFKDGQIRAKMTKLYDQMRRFCTKFPHTRLNNILLLGNTGTGKTHLISCIANYLISLGEYVLPITAFELVNRALNYHTSADSDKLGHLTPLLDADLLIIDDLGTESIFKNVTLEYLYLIINERLVKGKHTIITTNLDLGALETRYGSRITSRLLDKSSTYVTALTGGDIRRALQ